MPGPKSDSRTAPPHVRFDDRAPAPDRRQAIVISLALALLTFAAFARSLSNGFIDTYDDKFYVLENAHIKEGVTAAGIAYALTGVCVGNWHPLTMLSHMIDVQLFGTNAWGHHLTSLVLHIANTILLFWTLRAMTGATWRSAIVAALFSIHPLHVQSVAMVAQRKDVLSTLFMLLAIFTYARPKTGRGQMMWTALWLALSLLSKPMAVTLPVLLILLDIWPLRRIDLAEPQGAARGIWKLTVEKWPLFAGCAVMSVIVIAVQQSEGAVASLEKFPAPLRIANALTSYVAYIRLTFWPSNLAAFYPYAQSYPAWRVLGSLLFLLFVSACCLWRVKTVPYVLTGWGWYLVSLLPVIGIVQVGIQSMADRYTYVPLIGLFIAIVWGAHEICQTRSDMRTAAACAAVLAVAVLAPLTWVQSGYWSDTETLWKRDLAITENNYTAHVNLHVYYMTTGKYQEALEHGTEALNIRPSTNLILAVALLNKALQHPRAAERLLVQAKKMYPGLTRAYVELGLLYITYGQFDAAEREFAQVAASDADTEVAIGKAYLEKKEVKRAERHFSRAVEIDPRHAEANRFIRALPQ